MSNQETATPQAETRSFGGERWLTLVIATVIIVLDQVSKYLVIERLPLYESWAPFPAIANLFQFTHTTNTGAAFGMFQNGNLFFAIMAVIVSAFIVFYNFTLGSGNRMLRVALGLQLGGAIGNLIDRVTLGYVTDFLDFGPWPVFNLADTAIVAGVIVLALLLLQEQREESRQAKGMAESSAGEAAEQVDEGSAS